MMSVLVLLAAAFPAAADARLGIVINEDNSHFFGSRSPADMTLDGLHAWVDQYAGTEVSHLFLCPNAMRASFRSQVFDVIWELGDQKMPAEGHGKSWFVNAKLLDDAGLDPYAVWIARCREKGISPWLTMRMNDIHDVNDTTNFMHSTFWLAHPEYWRVPGSTGAWQDRAFDYAIPDVREHHMAFIRELLARYDADGLELDWMRFGYHFKPGHEEEGCVILTAFMRDVRALANQWAAKRGHAIKISARVPTHPGAAIGLGMDGPTWVSEGLVDMLVPTPFWATADFDIPLELWRERLGAAGEGIVLAAGQEVLLRAYPGGQTVCNDLASVRGFAAAAWHRGADQVYLFNYMDPAPMEGGAEAYRELLTMGLDKGVVAGAARRHVVTYRDTVPAGVPDNVQLPIEGRKGGALRVYTGPVPQEARARFVAGLAERDDCQEAAFEVWLNDVGCTPSLSQVEHSGLPGVARALVFDCPLSAVQEGYNTVRIEQVGQQAEQLIIWAELRLE